MSLLFDNSTAYLMRAALLAGQTPAQIAVTFGTDSGTVKSQIRGLVIQGWGVDTPDQYAAITT